MSLENLFRRLAQVAVATLIAVHSGSAVHAATPYKCKPKVSASAENSHQQYAQKAAIWAWRDKVTALYGSKYSSWPKALARSVSCAQKRSAPGWRCTASAKPCAYIPPITTTPKSTIDIPSIGVGREFPLKLPKSAPSAKPGRTLRLR